MHASLDAGGDAPESPPSPRRRPRRLLGPALGAAVVVAMLLATSLGPVPTPVGAVLLVALEPAAPLLAGLGVHLPAPDPAVSSLIGTIRLPRVLLAALTGAALACAGVVMQGVFRNPLAEPGITGVSSGAAAAAVMLLLSGVTVTLPWLLPLGAFVGALGTVVLVQLIAGIARPGSTTTLLLVGVALNAVLGAVISAAIANATDATDMQQAIFWLNGDLTASTWGDVAVVVAPVLLGVVVIRCFARDLDLLSLSRESAASTGVDTTVVRQVLLALAALVTAATVSVTGVIAFVGLVVPHLVRLVFGPGHRRLLPASIAVGAVFLSVADLAARLLFSPVVLQTGTVTALVGAPVLLLLVLRTRAA